MSKKVRASVRCPQCNHESGIELHRSIWIEEPDNRALILNDAINVLACPRCRLRQRLEFPFLATNVKRRFALWYEPYHDEQIDKDAAAYRKQFGPNNFLAKAPRIADWEEFKRVLSKLDASAPMARPDRVGIPADIRESSGTKGASANDTERPSSRPGLMNWFRRRSQTPPEVDATVDALGAVRSAFVETDPFVANAIDRSFAMARAEAVDQPDLTVHSISVDKWKPRDLAFLLLSKVSSRALSTGQYHTYRGVLGGEGRGYLRVFRKSVDALAQSGFITPQQAEADLAALNDQIRKAG